MGSFGTKFDSLKQEWTTPQNLFDKLNKEFDFDYDPCPLNGRGGLKANGGSETTSTRLTAAN